MEMQLEQTMHFAIENYNDTSVQVNGQHFTDNIIVTPENVIAHTFPALTESLSQSHCQPIFDLQPQLCLMGTWTNQAWDNFALTAAFANAGIGLEVMHRSSAFRTFNVLLSEGRHVVLAILPKPHK